MDFIWESITDWLKEILISGIVSNLSGMFDSTNEQVGNIVGQVGMTPQSWNSGIFTMIQNLSNTVILPIAGAILAIVMTLELIQLVTDRNNLNDVDTWMFFKWVFKSACAVVIVTHTWDIVMGIFEASQSVVSSAAGVIVGQTNIDISSVVGGLESRLNEMDLGPLVGLWFQSLFRVLFLRPKERPYRTNNFYAVLARQDKLDKEVYRIVHPSPKARTEKSGAGRYLKGKANR